MENIRNTADVIARLDESIDFYASRIKALESIKRLSKKDGSDFAVISKNFDGDKAAGVYIKVSPHYDEYRLDFSYRNAKGRYVNDWIDSSSVDNAFEKIEKLITDDHERMAAREYEKAKAETIANTVIRKLDEISAFLDEEGIEKRNTLRYAIGTLIKDYEYRI